MYVNGIDDFVIKAIHATLQDGSHRIWKKKSLLTTDKIWLVRMLTERNC